MKNYGPVGVAVVMYHIVAMRVQSGILSVPALVSMGLVHQGLA
jgi:hypothetical protein